MRAIQTGNQVPTFTPSVVLLLGAMSKTKPLSSVPDELSALKRIFEPYEDQEPFLELEYEPYVTRTLLGQKLDEYVERVAILHFAGHSSPDSLEMDDGVIHTLHLAKIFKTWKQPPQLVFLNGCDNAEQVEALHAAGIPLVIATHRNIDDKQASSFSREFYISLFSGNRTTSVQAAFERAGAKVMFSETRSPRSLDLDDFKKTASSEWDWSVFPAETAQADRTLGEMLPYAESDPVSENKPLTGHKNSLWIGIAAAIAVVLIAGFFLYQPQTEPERDSSIHSDGDLKFEASGNGSVVVTTGDGQVEQGK